MTCPSAGDLAENLDIASNSELQTYIDTPYLDIATRRFGHTNAHGKEAASILKEYAKERLKDQWNLEKQSDLYDRLPEWAAW